MNSIYHISRSVLSNHVLRHQPSYHHMMKRSICRVVLIKGLNPEFSDDDVKTNFSPFGILDISQLMDPTSSNKSRTLLLQYKYLDSAIACVEELHRTVVNGRRISVEYCGNMRPDSDEVMMMVENRSLYRPDLYRHQHIGSKADDGSSSNADVKAGDVDNIIPTGDEHVPTEDINNNIGVA